MLDVFPERHEPERALNDNAVPSAPIPQEGLDRLHDTLAGEVAAGHLPGLVSLVARDDDVHVVTIDTPSFADRTPLARDAIFRIASLTKPIVAAAGMMLVEEGVLAMNGPIDQLVPEHPQAHHRHLVHAAPGRFARAAASDRELLGRRQRGDPLTTPRAARPRAPHAPGFAGSAMVVQQGDD